MFPDHSFSFSVTSLILSYNWIPRHSLFLLLHRPFLYNSYITYGRKQTKMSPGGGQCFCVFISRTCHLCSVPLFTVMSYRKQLYA